MTRIARITPVSSVFSAAVKSVLSVKSVYQLAAASTRL
jgi:hypothetical protein